MKEAPCLSNKGSAEAETDRRVTAADHRSVITSVSKAFGGFSGAAEVQTQKSAL